MINILKIYSILNSLVLKLKCEVNFAFKYNTQKCLLKLTYLNIEQEKYVHLGNIVKYTYVYIYNAT